MGDTKTIKTPNDHEIVLKSGLTGREFREINGLMLRDATVQGGVKDGEEMQVSGIKGSIMQEMENKTLEIMLVSIDGKTEKLLDMLLEFPIEDFEAVWAKVQELTSREEKKTN